MISAAKEGRKEKEKERERNIDRDRERKREEKRDVAHTYYLQQANIGYQRARAIHGTGQVLKTKRLCHTAAGTHCVTTDYNSP